MSTSTKQRKHSNTQQQQEQKSCESCDETNSELEKPQLNRYNHNKRSVNSILNALSSWKFKLLFLSTIVWILRIAINSSFMGHYYESQRGIIENVYIIAPSLKTKHRNDGIGFNENLHDPLESHVCNMLSLPSMDNDCITYYPLVDLADYVTVDEMTLHSQNLGKNKMTSINDDIVSKVINVKRFSDYGILTRRGYKGGPMSQQVNQDRTFYMISPSYTKKDGNAQFLLGLFDGHGQSGHIISHFALTNYPKIFSSELKKTQYVQEAITKSFKALDSLLPAAHAKESGCTAIICFMHDDTLYIANTGDSHIYVVLYHEKTDNVEIIYRNQLHKPGAKDERDRIESLGGEVYIPDDDDIAVGEESEHKTDKHNTGLTSRVVIGEMALAMSRSIGDWEGENIGVIPDPTIDVMSNIVDLKERYTKNMFVFVASDGLIDEVTPLVASAHIANGLFKSNNILESCQFLIRMASESWYEKFAFYRDDISIVASKI